MRAARFGQRAERRQPNTLRSAAQSSLAVCCITPPQQCNLMEEARSSPVCQHTRSAPKKDKNKHVPLEDFTLTSSTPFHISPNNYIGFLLLLKATFANTSPESLQNLLDNYRENFIVYMHKTISRISNESDTSQTLSRTLALQRCIADDA